jgi:large subunit ribosomal protein L24e
MVVKRQCSFCAGEIEPGTGMMFVKRDGSVFHFCSSSCRKQQLHLGRVGHRLKWTRAHALKRAAEQSSPAAARALGRAGARKPLAAPAPSVTAPSGPKGPGGAVAEDEAPMVVEAAPSPATRAHAAPAAKDTSSASEAPVKKPRARKPKAPPAAA